MHVSAKYHLYPVVPGFPLYGPLLRGFRQRTGCPTRDSRGHRIACGCSLGHTRLSAECGSSGRATQCWMIEAIAVVVVPPDGLFGNYAWFTIHSLEGGTNTRQMAVGYELFSRAFSKSKLFKTEVTKCLLKTFTNVPNYQRCGCEIRYNFLVICKHCLPGRTTNCHV